MRLGPQLARLLLLELQLLDVALQPDLHVLGGALERAANLRADAQRVRVRVVDGGELRGELGAEAVREGLWDGGDDVGYADCDWGRVSKR